MFEFFVAYIRHFLISFFNSEWCHYLGVSVWPFVFTLALMIGFEIKEKLEQESD